MLCFLFISVVLCEIVSRVLPYHDQTEIRGYNDILDHVLDNGAIPTIPQWCEYFLRPLILDCLSRVPSSRPSFNEIILRLLEFVDLPDSVYFFQFDLPRIREQLFSNSHIVQALAANELAEILRLNKQIQRLSESEHVSEAVVKKQNDRKLALNNSLHDGIKLNKEESSIWVLDDDDASIFYERLINLLGTSEKDVQLAACRAILALLSSCSDTEKRQQDRELIVNENGIPALMALLDSPSPGSAALVKEAGSVLLLLASDLHHFQLFTSDNSSALQQFHDLVREEITRSHQILKEIEQKIDRKRELQLTLKQFIEENIEKERENGGEKRTNKQGRKEEEQQEDETQSNSMEIRKIELTKESGNWQAKFQSPDTPSSIDQQRLQCFEQLVKQLEDERSTAVPPHWADYYGSALCHAVQPALQWIALYREWKTVILLVLKEEIRVFSSIEDAPDDNLICLRTRMDGQIVSFKVESFQGMPNSITLSDCGELYAFCLGTPDQANKIQKAIKNEESKSKRQESPQRSSSNLSSAAPSVSAPAPVSSPQLSAFPMSWRPFVTQFGSDLSYCGFLFRQKRFSGIWVRAWFVLVSSSLHYYSDPLREPNKPEGTFYLCTNSGKAFDRKSSPKRQFSFSLANPSHTVHLAAESQEILENWTIKFDKAVQIIQQKIAKRNDGNATH